MKSFGYIASAAIVAAGMLAGQPAAFATDSPPTDTTAQPLNPTEAPVPDDRLKAAIAAIGNAPDPSSAVAAYAKGAAADPDGVTLERAYVMRLVKLGLPELAEAQARDLSKRRPDDGMAMAVVAYTDARKGNTTAALQEILIADRQAGDDPFVQRTAAQLLAYYDYKADHPRMDASVRAQLEQMRTKLRKTADYAEVYNKAADAYASEPPDQPTPAGTGTATTPPAGSDSAVPPIYVTPPPVYNYTYNTYASDFAPYTDPFACSYAAYPWWPSWWGWGPSLVVIDRSFSHRHFGFDHGRFDHGRFDHRDFGRNAFGHNSGFRGGQIGDIGSIGFRSSAFAGRSLGSSSSVGVRRSLPAAGGLRSAPAFRSAPTFRSGPAFRSLPSRGAMPSRIGGGRMGGFGGGGRVGGGGVGGRR